jgi:long-subunit fatty acid transport protein
VAQWHGSGFAAASTEASAIYYNPAALTRVGRFAIEGNTFEVFQDARYHHVAGAFQAPFCKRLWLGAAYSRVGIASTLYELDEEFNPIGKIEFQSDEWAFSLAAAVKISRHFSVGAGFKHEQSSHNLGTVSLGEFSNAALDLGLLCEGLLPSAHLSWRKEHRPWPWQKWAHQGLPPGFSLGVTLANIGLKSESGGAELLQQIDLDPSLPPIYVNPESEGALTDDFLLKSCMWVWRGIFERMN